jgi:hypothetical protein
MRRGNGKQLVAIVAGVVLVTGAGVYTGSLMEQDNRLRAVIASDRPRPVPVVTVTSPPKVITKTVIRVVPVPGPTRIVFSEGYLRISDDPSWNCAGAFYTAYVRLARGGPAGDSGIWQELCGNLPQPAN